MNDGAAPPGEERPRCASAGFCGPRVAEGVHGVNIVPFRRAGKRLLLTAREGDRLSSVQRLEINGLDGGYRAAVPGGAANDAA